MSKEKCYLGSRINQLLEPKEIMKLLTCPTQIPVLAQESPNSLDPALAKPNNNCISSHIDNDASNVTQPFSFSDMLQVLKLRQDDFVLEGSFGFVS